MVIYFVLHTLRGAFSFCGDYFRQGLHLHLRLCQITLPSKLPCLVYKHKNDFIYLYQALELVLLYSSKLKPKLGSCLTLLFYDFFFVFSLNFCRLLRVGCPGNFSIKKQIKRGHRHSEFRNSNHVSKLRKRKNRT